MVEDTQGTIDAGGYEIAFTESVRALSEQQAVLDGLRSRVGIVVSAAALATSFLGGVVLGDGVATWLTGVAIAAFVVAVAASLWVLWPREWTFVTSPKIIIGEYIEAGFGMPRLQRDLALHLEKYWDANQRVLDHLLRVYEVAIAFLAIEIVAWLLDLVGLAG